MIDRERRMTPVASTLKDRVRWMIDQFWEGSVNRAATDLGVLQPTLSRVASGTTPNPRGDLLRRIANGGPPGTTLDWLVSGVGDPPPIADEDGRPYSGGMLRWLRIVRQLPLEPDTDGLLLTALVMLPVSPGVLMTRFEGADALTGETVLVDSVWAAHEAIARAWATVLEGLIEKHGTELTANTLRKECQVIGLSVSAARRDGHA